MTNYRSAVPEVQVNAGAVGARLEPRTNIFILAALSAESMAGPVRIRNLSPSGALIEGATLPRSGEQFRLKRGENLVSGDVVWSRDGKAGLRFAGRVEVQDWMPGGNSAQESVDRSFQQIKAEPVRPSPSQEAFSARSFAPTDLRKLARAIDDLADVLAGDAALVARHGNQLQTLDLASQVLRALAEPGR